MLQQGVVAGQATVTAAAKEKLFHNRAALCHFFVDAADFERERRVLEHLTPAKHVPGWAQLLQHNNSTVTAVDQISALSSQLNYNTSTTICFNCTGRFCNSSSQHA